MYGLTGFLPSYLKEKRGLSLVASSNVMVAIGLVAFFSSIIGGYYISKYFLGKERYLICGLSIIIALYIFAMHYTKIIIACTAIIGVANMLIVLVFTVITSLPLKLFPPEQVAPHYTAINAIGVAGGFIAPILMDKLIEDSNGLYASSFFFLTSLALISGLSIMLIKQKLLDELGKKNLKYLKINKKDEKARCLT